MRTTIPEPWQSFVRDVDRALGNPVEVHCLGGFVLTVLWGLPRPTGDVDFVAVDPGDVGDELLSIAGEGRPLAKRYRLKFHRVTVAGYPEAYASRLVDITPKTLRRLRLLAFEVHDLVLAKLGRNSPRDREDVAFLARRGALDRDLLQGRFDAELRPYVLDPARDASSLNLWLDEFLGTPER